MEEWYRIYHICKKKKANKPSHLIFYFNLPEEMVKLNHEIGCMEYVPRESVCFDITYPRLREVIAADFADRLVQTKFTKEILLYYEERFFHANSYSCRVGKGAIRAIYQLQEYIFEETHGYTTDAWIAKIDLRNFFMSIDTDLAVDKVTQFILQNLPDTPLRDTLLYMCRVVYQSRPQMNCRMNSPMSIHMMLEEGKRMYHKDTPIGVAIGNVTNQLMAKFLTTFYLCLLESLGYVF